MILPKQWRLAYLGTIPAVLPVRSPVPPVAQPSLKKSRLIAGWKATALDLKFALGFARKSDETYTAYCARLGIEENPPLEGETHYDWHNDAYGFEKDVDETIAQALAENPEQTMTDLCRQYYDEFSRRASTLKFHIHPAAFLYQVNRSYHAFFASTEGDDADPPKIMEFCKF